MDRIEQNVETILALLADLGTPDLPDDEEDEPDVPPDVPPTRKQPVDYIQWDMRDDWSDRVFFAYTIWRGHRDLEYLLDNLSFVHMRGLAPLVTKTSLSVLIETMAAAHERQKRLSWRIENERHRDYVDRSQVRKSVAKEMINELNMLTREYGEIAALIPFHPDCDSIKCRIMKMQEGE